MIDFARQHRNNIEAALLEVDSRALARVLTLADNSQIREPLGNKSKVEMMHAAIEQFPKDEPLLIISEEYPSKIAAAYTALKQTDRDPSNTALLSTGDHMSNNDQFAIGPQQSFSIRKINVQDAIRDAEEAQLSGMTTDDKERS